MTKQPRRAATYLLPAIALLILAALAVGSWTGPARFPRLEVAGFRITREEYLRAMYQARNDVLSDHSAAGISLKDWSAETELGDPRQLAVDRTLEILREYYAVGTLAVERGYLSDAGYGAMLRDMETINSKRQEALESGGIVTGFSSFTPDDYISYRASSLRLRFCTDTANPEYPVTDEELLARYEGDRDNLYRQPDSVDLAFLEIEAGTAEQKLALAALREKALQTGDLAAALAEFPQLQSFYQEISVDPGSFGLYDRALGDVLDCASGLQTGGISQVIDRDGWLCLVHCIRRTGQQYAPLDAVASVVAQSIRESRYDALIRARMEAAEISGDLNRLYRFTAEYLP